MKRALSDFQPEIIFHLAAQPIVSQSYIDQFGTFGTNILGSVNLLAAVANVTSVLSLIYITSGECYENREWTWGYRESDSLGGFDPYSASKAAAELIFSSYSRSFLKSQETLFAATARAGNVIGGGADKVLVSKMAGHPNPTTTLRIYAHELDRSQENIRKTINKSVALSAFDRYPTDSSFQSA